MLFDLCISVSRQARIEVLKKHSPLLSTRDYESFSTLLKKISKSSYMTEHFFMHNNNHPQKKTPKIEAAAVL